MSERASEPEIGFAGRTFHARRTRQLAGARFVGALSRRVRTLIVSGVLFLVLLILTLTLPVPYVILSPGPTCNTLGTDTDCGGTGTPIIVIKGAPDQKRAGNLNLTTVGVTPTRS